MALHIVSKSLVVCVPAAGLCILHADHSMKQVFLQNLHELWIDGSDSSWQCPEHEELSQYLLHNEDGPLPLPSCLVVDEVLQSDNWIQSFQVLGVLCNLPSMLKIL